MKKLLKKKFTDLQKEFADKKAKLQDLRFKASGAKLRDDKAIRELKKDIARIATAMRLVNNK